MCFHFKHLKEKKGLSSTGGSGVVRSLHASFGAAASWGQGACMAVAGLRAWVWDFPLLSFCPPFLDLLVKWSVPYEQNPSLLML